MSTIIHDTLTVLVETTCIHPKPIETSAILAGIVLFGAVLALYLTQPGIHSWLNSHLIMNHVSIGQGVLLIGITVSGAMIGFPILRYLKRKWDFRNDLCQNSDGLLEVSTNIKKPLLKQKLLQVGGLVLVISILSLCGLLLACFLCHPVRYLFTHHLTAWHSVSFATTPLLFTTALLYTRSLALAKSKELHWTEKAVNQLYEINESDDEF